MALPNLPGYTIKDPSKQFHPKVTSFDRVHGVPVQRRHGLGVEPLDSDAGLLAQGPTTMSGAAQAGRAVTAVPPFVPAHIAFDKKVLMFTAYMKQTVHESQLETFRVRYFHIFYYLEDDTVSIVEPEIENSGLVQGQFLKRQRLPKDNQGTCYTWKDLNTGTNIIVYGKVLRLTSCNAWTRDYLQREGIAVNATEDTPADPYSVTRKAVDHPHLTHAVPSDFDELKQFLVLDRKVLRFFCAWDDRANMFGEIRKLILHYYLVDDTIELREVHEANDGHDPFPLLLSRRRIPRNHKDIPMDFPTVTLEVNRLETMDPLNPADFALGRVVHVYGRDLLPYDCDEFTKEFYRRNFNVVDFKAIDITTPALPRPTAALPPRTVFGSPEDSMQSVLFVTPQVLKKDIRPLLEFDSKTLRFSARLDTTHPDEQARRFIVSFFLASGYLTIHETVGRNSGFWGGKVLEAMKVQRPGCNPHMPEYYTAADLCVNTTLNVFGRLYILYDADEFVLAHMEAHPDTFPAPVIAAMRAHFAAKPKGAPKIV